MISAAQKKSVGDLIYKAPPHPFHLEITMNLEPLFRVDHRCGAPRHHNAGMRQDVLLQHLLPQSPEWLAGEHFVCPRCIQLRVA
jgi:hypothetical protein